MATSTSPSPDIRAVVQKARDELSGVIADITKVLMTVAAADDATEKTANGPAANTAQGDENEPAQPLEPVMKRFETLRKAVEQAEAVHNAMMQKAEQEESQIQPQQRAALLERRAALIEEVKTKNQKVKLLIDHLRELQRDILILVGSYYKPLSSQSR